MSLRQSLNPLRNPLKGAARSTGDRSEVAQVPLPIRVGSMP